MREIKDNKPIKGSTEYRRTGPPAPATKVSPLRGLKQRWTADAGITFGRTRREAIAKSMLVDNFPSGAQRVFI